MTTKITVRQELHDFIDAIPDHNLDIIRPMLSFLAKTPVIDEPLVIETDLTAEEQAIIAEGRKEKQINPSSFTPWSKVRRGLQDEPEYTTEPASSTEK
jgi:hypothetical protein